MSSYWAVVIASLGSSTLTIIGALGLELFRSNRHKAELQKNCLLKACIDLDTYAHHYISRGLALHRTAIFRSGIKEYLDILLYRRKPPDPLVIYDWLETDHKEMLEGYNLIKLTAQPELSSLATELIVGARSIQTTILSSANRQSENDNAYFQKIKILLIGLSSDMKLENELSEMTRTLQCLLKEFESEVRKTLGLKLELYK